MDTDIYPLKFYPILKEKIWGGNLLKKVLNKDYEDDVKIGESWEISTIKDNISIVSNGQFKGETLISVIDKLKTRLLGVKYENFKEFPLLYKLIGTMEHLSVQVHPDDETAMKLEGYQYGKTESWFIMHTESKKIILGLPENMSTEHAAGFIKNNEIEKVLNYTDIDTDNLLFIPAGVLHAILGGTLLAEIQQPSDITYRIYDWNRKDVNRKLDIEKSIKSLKNIPFNELKPEKLILSKTETSRSERLLSNEFFNIYLFRYTKKFYIDYGEDKFKIVTNLNDTVNIKYGENLENEIILEKGETMLIPACLNRYLIIPRSYCKLLQVCP